MSDPLRLLVPHLQPTGESDPDTLLVADENLVAGDFGEVPKRTLVVCNRADVAAHAARAGLTVLFNDFDFSTLPEASFGGIVFRISKEKAVTHHVINQSRRLLRPGGTLFLSGGKSEGLKTYARKAADYLGDGTRIDKQGKWYLAQVSKTGASDRPPLADDDYPHLRPAIKAGALVFFSKPGMYGWDKIDRGSALLAAALESFLATLPLSPLTVLDLGCGYGYLSARAAQLGAARLVATDNCAAAVAACRHNFAELGIAGEVVVADCADVITEKFAAVVCNPPFHQGFATQPQLLDKFLTATGRLVRPGGRALFVVNEFVPLEKRAEVLFKSIEVVTRAQGFKVIALTS